MDGRIFALLSQISETLDQEWDVGRMAKTVDLSQPRLHRLFKESVGNTPIAWLRDKRLEEAKNLLETTFRQINQIAREVGFTDHSHFTRDFASKYGASPREYRRLVWERRQKGKSEKGEKGKRGKVKKGKSEKG